MSLINGDKSRDNRRRKQRVKLREKIRVVKTKTAASAKHPAK